MKLTIAQRESLVQWLRTSEAAIKELDLEVTEVALMAREELGFDVSAGHICHRMGPTPRALIKHFWPGSESMIKSRSGQSATRIEAIVRMLEEIRSQLGVEPTEGWEEILAWATSRSSTAVPSATGSSDPSVAASS